MNDCSVKLIPDDNPFYHHVRCSLPWSDRRHLTSRWSYTSWETYRNLHISSWRCIRLSKRCDSKGNSDHASFWMGIDHSLKSKIIYRESAPLPFTQSESESIVWWGKKDDIPTKLPSNRLACFQHIAASFILWVLKFLIQIIQSALSQLATIKAVEETIPSPTQLIASIKKRSRVGRIRITRRKWLPGHFLGCFVLSWGC